MDLQIVEIDGLNKIILRESCLIVALKILNRSIQPDRFAQIKLIAYLIQCMEHLVSPRIIARIFDDGILYQMIILKYFCP